MIKISGRKQWMQGGMALGLALLLVGSAAAQEAAQETRTANVSLELPAWVDEVGARTTPDSETEFKVGDYGAKGDGETTSTAAIQQAIDAASEAGGGVVTFEPGTYVTGALFVKDNVHLRIDEGVTLFGSNNDADYPDLDTRVAGIEMEWPAALINVNNAKNVKLSGGGKIDGNGQKWWDYYWKLRREEYEPRGLRWASDYDAKRVRLMVIWKSEDVTVENLDLRRSGFWTVHICYSEYVTVDGVTVADNQGPSTDGVNADSSRYVLIQNCDIDNNDDCICMKAGRDWDGLRVNRPCEYVVVRNNITRRGDGIVSFGSETSGWIRHIVAYDNTGIGTDQGIRFKSARVRGGGVEDVLIRNIKMEGVPRPITFTSNWNPSYSYASIPEGIEDVPEHWVTMNKPVEPEERGWPEFHNIVIGDLEIEKANTIISIEGLPGKPVHDVHLINITAQGKEAGSMKHVRNVTMENVTLITDDGEGLKLEDTENVDTPVVKAKE